MEDLSAREQIDAIIAHAADWRGEILAQLRTVILNADSSVTEEVKWKKPSRPEGVAVWFSNGNICMADVLKNAVRLTFPKGAELPDPTGVFNTRLDSRTMRAVDFPEDTTINEAALANLVRAAVRLNQKQ